MRAAVLRVSPRRGFLVTMGLGWAGYGKLGILGNPRYGTSRGLDDITKYAPMNVLGWMWVALGLVAVLAGLAVRCPRMQSLGFTALAVPAGLWGTAFTIAAATSYAAGAGSACGWVAFALGIVWVAGMDDPPPPHLRKKA
ncbi:hypothetical protein HY68_12685 [Streptomyces sp. AcH 505]|uniref:hypothetical protein n=1 Tax=Streptomyces sp. AcH 505 TaxID=352211 RepID=UPI00059193BA|nr:hypothetical protein HY68_12685 [Streptomyces sp. AcH 505]